MIPAHCVYVARASFLSRVERQRAACGAPEHEAVRCRQCCTANAAAAWSRGCGGAQMSAGAESRDAYLKTYFTCLGSWFSCTVPHSLHVRTCALPLKVALHILYTTSVDQWPGARGGQRSRKAPTRLRQLELLVVLVFRMELGDDLVLREEPSVHQVLEALRILVRVRVTVRIRVRIRVRVRLRARGSGWGLVLGFAAHPAR